MVTHRIEVDEREHGEVVEPLGAPAGEPTGLPLRVDRALERLELSAGGAELAAEGGEVACGESVESFGEVGVGAVDVDEEIGARRAVFDLADEDGD